MCFEFILCICFSHPSISFVFSHLKTIFYATRWTQFEITILSVSNAVITLFFFCFYYLRDSMKVGLSNIKFVLSHSWASSSFLQNLFYQLFIRRKCHVKFVKLVPTCVTNGRRLFFFSYECSRWRSNRLYNGPLQMGKNKNNGNYFRKNLPWKFYYVMFRPANRNSEKKVVGLLHRLH